MVAEGTPSTLRGETTAIGYATERRASAIVGALVHTQSHSGEGAAAVASSGVICAVVREQLSTMRCCQPWLLDHYAYRFGRRGQHVVFAGRADLADLAIGSSPIGWRIHDRPVRSQGPWHLRRKWALGPMAALRWSARLEGCRGRQDMTRWSITCVSRWAFAMSEGRRYRASRAPGAGAAVARASRWPAGRTRAARSDTAQASGLGRFRDVPCADRGRLRKTGFSDRLADRDARILEPAAGGARDRLHRDSPGRNRRGSGCPAARANTGVTVVLDDRATGRLLTGQHRLLPSGVFRGRACGARGSASCVSRWS
jgi:hypothetical protein